MIQEGDGKIARRISDGVCPKCETQMNFKSDGFEEDYMVCGTCNLQMLTPRHAEMEIVVELEM